MAVPPATRRAEVGKTTGVGRTSQIAESTGTEVPQEVLERMTQPDYCFEKFVLVDELGKGGMGVVWKAWQRDLKRWVAIKFLTAPDEEELQRFCREAQTAARLSHPNICSIFDLGEYNGQQYIVMEYIDGPSLFQIGKVNPQRAMAIIRDASLALNYAHGEGVIHRDIKPHNIMVNRTGRVYVMDFGLAKAVRAESGMTVPGMILGTPSYMPPEQAEGKTDKIDRRSDVYSMGATLHTILMGKPPFAGRSPIDIMYKVCHSPPPSLRTGHPEISKDLEAVVFKAMKKDAALRYPTAKALAADLELCIKGEPLTGQRRSTSETLMNFLKSPAGKIAAVAAILLPVVFAIALVMGKSPSDNGPGTDGTSPKTADRGEAKSKARPSYDKAVEAYDEARQVYQVEGETWNKLVDLCNRSIKSAGDALKIHPTYEDALLIRGRARALQEDFEGAEKDFMAALAIDPNLSIAERELGLAFITRAEMAGRKGTDDRAGKSAAPEVLRWKESALKHFKRYSELSKDSSETLFAKASLALTEGKAAEALTLVSELLRSKMTVDVFLLKARSCYAMQKFGDAVTAIQEVLRRQRNHFEALRSLVRTYTEMKDFPKAMETLERVLAIRSDDSWALSFRSTLQAEAGRHDMALKDIEAAVARNPRDAQALVDRSYIHFKAKRYKEAIEDADLAIKADPKCFEAYENKGLVYIDQRKFTEAAAEFDAALKINDLSVMSWSTRGVCRYVGGDFGRALTDLSRALELDPDHLASLVSRGATLIALDREKDGNADFKKAASYDPSKASPQIWEAIFNNLADSALHDDLLECVNRFIDREIPGPALPYWRARAYIGLGRYQDAKRDLEAFHKVSKPTYQSLLHRGLASFMLKEYEEAIPFYTDSIKIKTTGGVAYQNRGACHACLGRLPEALADYKAAYDINPKIPNLKEDIEDLELQLRK